MAAEPILCDRQVDVEEAVASAFRSAEVVSLNGCSSTDSKAKQPLPSGAYIDTSAVRWDLGRGRMRRV